MLHNPPTCCCKQVISSFHRAQKQPTETTVMFSIKVILFELIEGIMGVMGRWLRYVDEQKRGLSLLGPTDEIIHPLCKIQF